MRPRPRRSAGKSVPSRDDGGPDVVLSVPWSSPWTRQGISLPPGVRLHVRAVDWQLSPLRRLAYAVRESWLCFRAARGAAALVVCTTGADSAVLGAFMRMRPGQPFALYDVLLPRRRAVRRLAKLPLRRVDLWLVIRRGDEATFRRDLGARDCRFVPFPVPGRAVESGQADQAYVYAAGTAHRDWPTLLEACRSTDIRVVLSTNAAVNVPPELSGQVELIGLVTSDMGRARIAGAAAVCLPMLDTELPSGPLLVLDALAAGKALVASDVNGTRDYVVNGQSALLVPPGDPLALRRALQDVLSSAALRDRLGAAGLAAAAGLASDRVLAQITAHVLAAAPRRGRSADEGLGR